MGKKNLGNTSDLLLKKKNGILNKVKKKNDRMFY